MTNRTLVTTLAFVLVVGAAFACSGNGSGTSAISGTASSNPIVHDLPGPQCHDLDIALAPTITRRAGGLPMPSIPADATQTPLDGLYVLSHLTVYSNGPVNGDREQQVLVWNGGMAYHAAVDPNDVARPVIRETLAMTPGATGITAKGLCRGTDGTWNIQRTATGFLKYWLGKDSSGDRLYIWEYVKK